MSNPRFTFKRRRDDDGEPYDDGYEVFVDGKSIGYVAKTNVLYNPWRVVLSNGDRRYGQQVETRNRAAQLLFDQVQR